MTQPAGKILLVDDDRFFLKVLSDAFASAGFAVCTAGDGVEGVSRFVEARPDVVISDLIMPRMGGVSTLVQIGRLAGEGSEQPVLILLTSMFQGAPHEHPHPEMGARVHIPKSTPLLDIVIIVEQLLERNRMRQSAA